MESRRQGTPGSMLSNEEEGEGLRWGKESFVRGRVEELEGSLSRMTAASWKEETRRFRVRRYEDRLFEARMTVFILEAMISLEKSRDDVGCEGGRG